MTADAAPVGRRRLVVAIGFELWLFVFVAFVGTTLLWTQPTLRLAALALFALPVIAWTILRVRRPYDVLDIAILVGIAAHLAVSLLSLDREASLESSGIVVVHAGAFWLARRVAADDLLGRTAAIAVVMALAFWLAITAITWVSEKVAYAQSVGWPPPLGAHQTYAWGSINTPPVLLLLALPFAAWLPRRGLRRALIVLLALTAVVIVPFSVGRAAWLGIGVAIVALEVLFGFPLLGHAWRAVRARGWRTAVLGLAALVAVLGGLLAIGAGGFGAALDSRMRLWQQAAGLFSADPLTGAGPTTFSWARLAHVPDFTDRVAAAAAHSVPLHTLAEGGLVLAAALLFIVTAWTWRVVVGRRQLDRPRRVAVAALVGFAAFSLFDDFSFLPAVTILVITLAAWVLPPRTESKGPAPRSSRRVLVPAVVALAALMTAPTAISLGTMRIEQARARADAVDGRWAAALSGFRSAARAQPMNALHWMSVGLAEYKLGNVAAAESAYLRAREVSPGDPRPWGALAALSQGDETIELLREAARRANDPQYAYRLAESLLAEGRSEEAAEYFAVASVIWPTLYGALPDQSLASVRAALDEAIGRVGSLAGLDPHEALWNATLRADDIHPGAPAQWRVARLVDAGDVPAASAALRDAVRNDPGSPRTWEAASAFARLTCDQAGFRAAERRLDLRGREPVPGSHEVEIGRPRLYGEPELGDYQPLEEPSLRDVPQWPLGLIEVPDCGW